MPPDRLESAHANAAARNGPPAVNDAADAGDWIAFDDIAIDVRGHRLLVGGVAAALEPKAFAVLVLLAREPGRVFTRDEILDAVWGHRHVTPGVLNRAMTLLRQALGESGGDSRYLHTVHGIGYRFERPRRDPPPAVPATAPTEAPAAAASSSTPPDRVAGDVARARPWLAGLALVVIAVVATVAIVASRGTVAPAASTPTPTLIVLPLHPVGSDHDESVLADGLSEELITRLSGVEGLRLISRTSAALAQSEKIGFDQLAQRYAITHALEGSLRETNRQLRVDLRLVEVPGGRTLWAHAYDRSADDVLRLESDIAQEVARALALRFGLAADEAALPVDPRLYQEYLEARREAHVGQAGGGVPRLRAILDKAPDYARAHATLARLLVSNLRIHAITPAELEEGKLHAQRALALDPKLTETQTALAILACRDAQWAKCFDLFEHALALEPNDSDARTSYAYWLSAVGYLDEAIAQAKISWKYDPLNRGDDFVIGRLLDTVGRHDEARPYIDANSTVWAKWYNAAWRQDFAAAAGLADSMPADGYRDSYRAITQALIDPSLWPQVAAAIAADETRAGRPNIAALWEPSPDYGRMIPALETMLRDGWPSYYLLLWMPEQASLRADPRFQEMLERNGILAYWNSRGWPSRCHPEGRRAVCP